MKLQRPGYKRCIFIKKYKICMFEYLFLAFFLSLGAVPFFFLGGSPSIGRPPQQVRTEGLSLWPMGGCFLQVCRAPCSIFFGAVDFGSSRNAKKKHAERKLSGSWLRRNRTRFFSYVDLVRIDSFATHHCSLVNLSYRSTVSFIVTPHD